MGKRGPAPTPTAILRARGSWRGDIQKAEPQFSGVPTRPEFLSAAAAVEWDRVVNQLVESGVVTEVDRAALAVYCEAWSDFVKACDFLNGKGAKITHAMAMKRSAMDSLLKAAAQFGLTPSARSRVQAIEGKNAVGDDKARFFKAS